MQDQRTAPEFRPVTASVGGAGGLVKVSEGDICVGQLTLDRLSPAGCFFGARGRTNLASGLKGVTGPAATRDWQQARVDFAFPPLGMPAPVVPPPAHSSGGSSSSHSIRRDGPPECVASQLECGGDCERDIANICGGRLNRAICTPKENEVIDVSHRHHLAARPLAAYRMRP